MDTFISQLSWLDGCHKTMYKRCHRTGFVSFLTVHLGMTARSHDSVHKWKPPGSIRAHASFRRQKQRTCPSSMSLCMPGLSCSVLLVLLMERLCDLRFCLTWRAAALFPLSTGITPQWRPTTHFLPETEQSHGRVCLILQQRGSRMCPLLDYFCMWCVNNKLNIERGNLKSLLITYWRYMLSLLWVQVDLMLVKHTS